MFCLNVVCRIQFTYIFYNGGSSFVLSPASLLVPKLVLRQPIDPTVGQVLLSNILDVLWSRSVKTVSNYFHPYLHFPECVCTVQREEYSSWANCCSLMHPANLAPFHVHESFTTGPGSLWMCATTLANSLSRKCWLLCWVPWVLSLSSASKSPPATRLLWCLSKQQG